ncbi:hypothetical protein Dimus_017374 [Dionaea muscipula]
MAAAAADMLLKQKLAKQIQLADLVIKAANEAASFKQECGELKSKTAKVADLLRQAARSSSELYDRPTVRILDDTHQVIDKALSLALKCRPHGLLKRAFTIIPAAAFRKSLSLLDNSIGNLSWLLRVSAPENSGDSYSDYLGLPPIAANEPILCIIWEQVAILYHGSDDDKSEAASSLVSLARGNDLYGKLIIDEGAVGPLLKLVKEGKVEGQENAAKAIGLLGRDPESVEVMVKAGVCQVFAKILKDGHMKVQAMVAWAISELAAHHPNCQDHFAQHNAVRLLVGHLAFETIQEHSKYTIATQKASSVHQAVVMAAAATGNYNVKPSSRHSFDDDDHFSQIPHPNGKRVPTSNRLQNIVETTLAMKAQVDVVQGNGGHTNPPAPASNGGLQLTPNQSTLHHQSSHQHSHSHSHSHSLSISGSGGHGVKSKESKDPATKANMKAQAARALWHLAKGNSAVCRSMTESRALLCFAVLLEKGAGEIQYNSAMALMEITAVAERDSDLRRSAFKPNSPASKAVVEQLLRIIEEANSDLLLPCIKAVGNLARTFRTTETRIIGPLVQLLNEREAEVCREAAITLTKFAGSHNYLHLDHSKAIISAGGIKHLIQLVYFGEQIVQPPALVLLSYIALHVPDSEELARNEVLTILEWASKQAHLTQNEFGENLLDEAKSRVQLYQSRGSK